MHVPAERDSERGGSTGHPFRRTRGTKQVPPRGVPRRSWNRSGGNTLINSGSRMPRTRGLAGNRGTTSSRNALEAVQLPGTLSPQTWKPDSLCRTHPKAELMVNGNTDIAGHGGKPSGSCYSTGSVGPFRAFTVSRKNSASNAPTPSETPSLPPGVPISAA